MSRLRSIFRYPVKGLSPELLTKARLTRDQTIPGDRLYAIENGPSGFDPVGRPYLHKSHFLMLMKNERLASLRTTLDLDTHVLTIHFPSPRGAARSVGAISQSDMSRGGGSSIEELPTPNHCPPLAMLAAGGEIVRAALRTADGRAAVEKFFAAYCADDLRGPPKILHAEGHSFSDVARKVVSIINLASVAAIENMVGAKVDPLRFRGNLYIEGWPAWDELDLVGKVLRIGGAVHLKVLKRIVRCAATNVDPDTGVRDLNVPQALQRELGHRDCGVYAAVIEGGEIAAGDAVEIG